MRSLRTFLLVGLLIIPAFFMNCCFAGHYKTSFSGGTVIYSGSGGFLLTVPFSQGASENDWGVYNPVLILSGLSLDLISRPFSGYPLL